MEKKIIMVKTIQTYTNKYIDVFDAKEKDIDIEDIASALSKICRFGGHCSEFYSVAQHSIHISELVPTKFKLHALLHDASEAYLCDIPRPIKYSNEFKFYLKVEKKLSNVIYKKFNLPLKLDNIIKDADNSMLLLEELNLMPNISNIKNFNINIIPDNINIFPTMDPNEAKQKFLEKYFIYPNPILA